ncbi:hypothetical protein ACHAQA_006572 [Verticillium albo-atrum]
MFRPPLYDPRWPDPRHVPDYGFNSGVHISTYNTFNTDPYDPYDPHPPRYYTRHPRHLFSADLPPLDQYYYRNVQFNDFPPLRAPPPPSLPPLPPFRSRPRITVTVILPTGERALLDRTHLLNLLPRTRNAPHAGRGPVFDLAGFLADYNPGLNDIPAETFTAGFTTALTFVIRHIEALGQHHPRTALFSRHRALLDAVPARDQPVLTFELFTHAFFVCCALDQDRALGCADGLALEVLRWLLDLLPRVQLLGGPAWAVYLFVGFARVFRATRPQVAVLGAFWNALDEEERRVVNGLVGERASGEGREGNTARVLDALRGLRAAGIVE